MTLKLDSVRKSYGRKIVLDGVHHVFAYGITLLVGQSRLASPFLHGFTEMPVRIARS